MTTPALVTLILAVLVLFGGLAASVAHAVVAERRRLRTDPGRAPDETG